MATSIKQYTYTPWTFVRDDANLTDVNKRLYKMTITSVEGSDSEGGGQYAPYQQLILQHIDGEGNVIPFRENTDYYLQLQIPKDPNYDMTFGLRLFKFEGADDLDRIEFYQLIRYITVKRQTTDQTPLYCGIYTTRSDSNNEWTSTKVAIFEQITLSRTDPLPESVSDIVTILKNNTPNKTNSRNGKGYYFKIKAPITAGSDEYVEHKLFCYWLAKDNPDDPDKFRSTVQETLAVNGVLLMENWKGTSKNKKQTFKLTFRPKIECDAIYFYLIPIPQDNDVQWLDSGNIVYYGRHIEDAENTINALYRDMPSVLDISPVQYIGVWGHPEQLMSINGEEIRIGPSGYYELRDFDVTSLGIVSLSDEDKYTVDVQYHSS